MNATRPSHLTTVLASLLSAFLGVANPSRAVSDSPLAPAEALKTLATDPGLMVELVAAEPLVISPSAFAWDAEARLFVAENPGYPTGPGPGKPPAGTIVQLSSSRTDGVMDRRILFADGLGFPNSLMPWRGGLLVTDSPNLLWLADTNGDGRADVREVWFTGFATNQTTQLRACYPTLAPDGWIYVARGWSAGVVTSPRWTNLPPVDLKDGDFRFRPDGSAAEAIGANSQFGMVIDDANRRFLVSNRNPLMHAVVHPRFWRRNPALAFTDVAQDVSAAGYEAKVFPRSPDTTTSGFMPELMAAPHAGTFTSACGIHQFQGEGLGVDYNGSWFICEPAQSLVQRQIPHAAGPTFASRRAAEDRDFLTSTDGWFRPVFAATGPDGAFYIADMYRRIIDHPDYLPEDARGRLDFVSGKDMGRLWRVRRTDFKPRPVNLADATVPSLLEQLGATNNWIRQTAFRLLMERRPDAGLMTAVVKSIEPELLQGSQPVDWKRVVRREADPSVGPHLGIARRLWLLSSLLEPIVRGKAHGGELGNRAQLLLISATLHPSPTVREVAWRIFQDLSHDPKAALPDVPYDLVAWWADDPNAAVRFQFALQCGAQGDWSPVVPALVHIARRDATNRWTRAAVLSGLKGREDEFVRRLLAEPPVDPPGFAELAADLGRMSVGVGQPNAALIEAVLAPKADHTAWQMAALRGIAEGLRSRGSPTLIALLRKAAPTDAAARERLSRLEEIGSSAARAATQKDLDLPARIAALQFLAELDLAVAREPLVACLAAGQPLEIQIAAARSLGRFNEPEIGRLLADRTRWDAFPQPVRDLALAALTARSALLPALFDALERGDMPVWIIDPQRRRQLQNTADPGLKVRARKLFADVGGADRRKVYEELKSVLAEPASGVRGHAVFTRTCATCHQLGGEGIKVGPDLSGVRNQPAEALLLHIIVPDAEIYPGFQACEVETRDGRSLTGLLAAETPGSLVLRRAGGEQETVTRSNVAAFSMSRVSLMPQELEKSMTRQELGDLIAYLRGRP